MFAGWFIPALVAALRWCVAGILQKLGSNRVNASSLLAWVTAGYVLVLPLFWRGFMHAVTQNVLWGDTGRRRQCTGHMVPVRGP
jgi:uncharacterized membrane protein